MAYINDKNLPYLVEKLSNADNIKINNNKHGSRVSTVINSLVTKSDDITKALEQEVINDNYSFKVGTGDVNVSADVQDGFGEIGIKGVTYQNVFNDFSINGEANKYITTNGNKIKWTKPATTTFNVNIKYHNSLAQLNKTYTLVFYVYKNTLKIEGAGNSYDVAKFNITSYDVGVYSMPVNKTGLVQVKLTQPTTTRSDGKPYLEVYKETVGELEISYPVLLEGDHTNNPNLLLNYFEGIVGVGDKSKNLFNINDTVIGFLGEINNILPPDHNNLTSNYIKVKPNTRYTYSIGGYDKPTNVAHWSGWYYYKDKYGTLSTITPDRQTKMGPDDSYKTMSFTTPSDCNYIRIGSRHLSLPNAWAQLEGSEVATPYEPFTYKIEILSSGHNLLDLLSLNCITKRYVTKHELTSNSISFSVAAENSDPWASVMFDGFKFKENATYRIKAKCKTTDNTNAPFISLRQKDDYNKSFINARFTNGILNTTFLANNVGDRVEFFAGVDKGNKGGCRVEFWDVSITEELSNEDLPFQPYLKDTNSIAIDSPLMRLPNGVCDEITRDGKLIRRVGKIVLNGSEDWRVTLNTDNITNRYDFKFDKFKRYDGIVDGVMPNMYCDSLPLETFTDIYQGNKAGLTHYWSNNNLQTITIGLKDSKTLTEFKQWLSQNPTTVYYELSTPVITEFPAPCLRIFKDGQITFNTLVIPESNHVVQLNKSAQIESTNKEVNRLENRVANLENFYDDVILETSYKLALLDYDFEYTKEREDE